MKKRADLPALPAQARRDTALAPMAPEAPLTQLAYCSVLEASVGEGDLQGIITHAQTLNARRGITGSLMVQNALVVQWIEGPEPQVELLWQKLLDDSRHHSVVLLIRKSAVSQRLFPQWSMQHVSRADLLEIVSAARQTPESPWADEVHVLWKLLTEVAP